MSRKKPKKKEEPEEEEEEWGWYNLTTLPGVDETLHEKLKEHGYESIFDIAEAGVDDLTGIREITKKKAKKIIEAAKKLIGW